MTKAHSEPDDNGGLCEGCNRPQTRYLTQTKEPVKLGGGLGMGTMWLCAECVQARRLRVANPPEARVTSSEPLKKKFAAVSFIERNDGKILCVWNKRYGCWAMPGGMVEDGETAAQAQGRELLEETGLTTHTRWQIYDGPHTASAPTTRGSHVIVFRVTAGAPDGTHREPRECEEGCPVTWLTREEFLKWSAFAEFYKPMFEKVPFERNERSES